MLFKIRDGLYSLLFNHCAKGGFTDKVSVNANVSYLCGLNNHIIRYSHDF